MFGTPYLLALCGLERIGKVSFGTDAVHLLVKSSLEGKGESSEYATSQTGARMTSRDWQRLVETKVTCCILYWRCELAMLVSASYLAPCLARSQLDA